ncbi:MAG: hypothetical protein PGN11_15470 [Quadrisphaera sp.]
MAVGSAAVGTVLAAAGTALPESVVTLVAVLFGSQESGADVGVGAALGGPLVVGSLAYAVVGVVLLANRRAVHRSAGSRVVAAERVGAAGAPTGSSRSGGALAAGGPTDAESAQLAELDTRSLARDQTWFLVSFALAAGLGLVAFAVKPWLGWVFFGVYAVYCWRQVRASGDAHSAEDLEPLKAQPRRERPSTTAVVTQVVVSLAVIFAASQVFVGQLEALAPQLGLSASLVALLLAPVATGAAGDAQRADLGPQGQGVARAGQPGGLDGHPGDHPHGPGPGLHQLARAGTAAAGGGRHPAVRGLPAGAVRHPPGDRGAPGGGVLRLRGLAAGLALTV